MAKRDPPKPPHPGDLIKLIRRLAEDGKISWSDHAFDERSPERGIEIADVLEVFRLGDIEGDITPGKSRGEWKCCVVGKLQWTSREAGVVTVVARKTKLIVVTVEWMDP
jgi:hypothetical protein